MKLAIEISEEIYKRAREYIPEMRDNVWDAIVNGVQVPEGTWCSLEDYEEYLSKKENKVVRILSPKGKYFCSNCWDDFNWLTLPNYCPHCGAKMSNSTEVIKR